MWIWKPLIFLFLFHWDQYVLTYDLDYQYLHLYEGSQCRLASGFGEGVCVKAVNCPERVRQILRGDHSRIGRCGFDKFDEIYCCPNHHVPKSEDRVRPAESACRRYEKLFKELEADGYVHASAISGVLAEEGEFPHMAALGYPAPEVGGLRYLCGGTLISFKHILTAAHCVSNVQGLVPVQAVLGANDLGEIESPGRQRIPISRIIEHPEHRLGLNYHDLAILELEYPAGFTLNAHPTCLMTTPLSRETVDVSLVGVGWGGTNLGGTTSMKLLKAEGLKFVKKNSCGERYRYSQSSIPNGLAQAMICISNPDTTRTADTCWGDGGGPLLTSAPTFPRLIGVSSFGQACGGPAPGVYTAVYKYLNWIEDEVWPAVSH